MRSTEHAVFKLFSLRETFFHHGFPTSYKLFLLVKVKSARGLGLLGKYGKLLYIENCIVLIPVTLEARLPSLSVSEQKQNSVPMLSFQVSYWKYPNSVVQQWNKC